VDEDAESEPVRIRVVGSPGVGRPVVVGEYHMTREGRPVTYYVVQPEHLPLEPDFDREPLTRYLFLGAALMTLTTLLLLWRRLPDLFLRSLLWRRALRRKVTVLNVNHLPTAGAVLLATNADNLDAMLQVLAAVDRYACFLLPEGKGGASVSGLVRGLARRHGLGVLRVGEPEGADWKQIEQRADRALGRGLVVGLPLDGGDSAHRLEDLVEQLGARRAAPVAPVYCEVLPAPEGSGKQNVYVVFGPPLAPGTPGQAVRSEIQRLGDELKEQLRKGVDLSKAEVAGH
jgi:hypothetical protein